MTWVRTDDGCPYHPKMLRAGAEACWLWQSGNCYSNAHRLDGRIGKDLLPALYPPLASKAKKLAAKLVEVGLWHDRGDHYEIHDYHQYQEQALKEVVEARREYERERKRKQRKAGHVPDNVPDNTGGVPDPCPSGTSRAPASRPGPARPEGEDPPSPLPDTGKPPDPMGDHLRGTAPGQREDVRQLFDAWKRAVQRPNAKLRGSRDPDAVTLAEVIDLHGLDDCLLVARYAPSDGMVSGKLDDKGRKHPAIRYIFGNADAFNRILHAAHEAEGKSSRRRDIRDVMAEARSL